MSAPEVTPTDDTRPRSHSRRDAASGRRWRAAGQQRNIGIVFDVDLIYLARQRGYRIAIVPIRWSAKRGSRMHPRLHLGMRVVWDLFRIPFLHRRVARLRS